MVMFAFCSLETLVWISEMAVATDDWMEAVSFCCWWIAFVTWDIWEEWMEIDFWISEIWFRMSSITEEGGKL